MTESSGDYFTMTGEHYEDGVHTLTSTRTQPGRYGGDLSVSLPGTAAAEREASRDALYTLIETMPVEWAGKVERAACDLAVSEWGLALANVLRGFTSDVGDPSIIYLERGAAEFRPEPGRKAAPAPLADRTRRRVWRVTTGLVAALAAGMLFGAAAVAGSMTRRRSR